MKTKKVRLKFRVISLLFFLSFWGIFCSVYAKNTYPSLTSGERATFLALARQNAKVKSSLKTQYLTDIENAIRNSNTKNGKLDKTFREPISRSKLRALQFRALARGQFIRFREISAATDSASALMREIGPNSRDKSLVEKIKKFNRGSRPGFHGNIAEYAEARARGNGTVLTKDKQSKYIDLTQRKKGPNNYQMKIYSKGGSTAAFNSVVDDILDAGKVNGQYKVKGILTSEDLKFNEGRGRLKRISNDLYTSTKHSNMLFQKSKAFSRPGLSGIYAKEGIQSLKNKGLNLKESDRRMKGKISHRVGEKLGKGIHS